MAIWSSEIVTKLHTKIRDQIVKVKKHFHDTKNNLATYLQYQGIRAGQNLQLFAEKSKTKSTNLENFGRQNYTIFA